MDATVTMTPIREKSYSSLYSRNDHSPVSWPMQTLLFENKKSIETGNKRRE